MLQQTQTSRVLEKFPEFIRRFPTLQSLARARRRSVIVAWRGMGYNNRAVRLHQLALTVLRDLGGTVPRNHDALLRLPGVGRYTANAVLSFAFHRRVPVVETNIRRVLSRSLFRMQRSSDLADPDLIWDEAAELLPERESYNWNQALMDLGARICTARNPHCVVCPVSLFCASSRSVSTHSTIPPKREPSFNGIPNRIYRGRIVDLLRNAPNSNGLSVARIGPKLHSDFNTANFDWLRSLLASLERDGLVRVTNRDSVSGGTVRLA